MVEEPCCCPPYHHLEDLEGQLALEVDICHHHHHHLHLHLPLTPHLVWEALLQDPWEVVQALPL
jgi:hypothetical protein